MSNLRRSMMMAGRGGGSETDLTGWQIGKALTSANYVQNNANTCVSPFYATSVGTQYRVHAFQTYDNNNQCKFIFTSAAAGANRVSQTTITSSTYTTTAPLGAYYFRIACMYDDIDNCYIYDVTNSVYLWKGKNVT